LIPFLHQYLITLQKTHFVLVMYAALGAKICGIAEVLKTRPEAKHIGVITNNDIETSKHAYLLI
jgi:hypothetical protein